MTTPTTPETRPEVDAAEQAAAPEGDGQGEAPRPNREARYRVERNEARAERDALAARVEQMQLHQVEHYAAQHLAEPKDLLALSGLELSDLLTEDGFADPEKIRVAAAEVVAARPGTGLHSPAFDPSQGHGGAGKTQPSWGTLLKP
jgi:hypothetical protein